MKSDFHFLQRLVALFVFCLPLFAIDTVNAAEANKHQVTRTIFLDINPEGAFENDAQKAYDAILETLFRAKDLGAVISRHQFGDSPKFRHIVQTCRGMENKRCFAKFGRAVKARYVIYGRLRDVDDALFLQLEMLDIETIRVVESVNQTIVKPVENSLVAKASEAACRLTRLYGCTEEEVAKQAAQVAEETQTSPKEEKEKEKPAEEAFFTDDPAPQKAEKSSTKREMSALGITGWALTGTSIAALGGAIAMNVMMFQAKDDYDKATDRQTALDKKDETKTYMYATWGLYAGGGLLLAGGITCLVLDMMNKNQAGSGDGNWTLTPIIQPKGVGAGFSMDF